MGKIIDFTSKYSNKSTASGYKSAIESFLRCINNLPKKDKTGKKIPHDYETLFDQYLKDKKRDRNADFTVFANCLKVDAVSAQSARQVMTNARYLLNAHGIKLKDVVVQDLKREMKGGAGTVDKVMTAKVIDAALKEMDVRGRALVLTLASSGARLNEVLSLNLSDIDLESDPVKITIRGVNAKNKQNRYSFLSDEAAQCVRVWLKKRDDYLKTAVTRNRGLIGIGKSSEKVTDTDLVFPFSDNAANSMWETALKASGQFSLDPTTGRNQYRIHSFRKFFISQLSMAGQKVLAEHLAGHLGYLDTSYRQVSSEQAGAEYRKVQDVVTIGVPMEYKEIAKEQDKKLRMQGESIEGLRAINDRLQNQMQLMQEKNSTLHDRLQQIEQASEDQKNNLNRMVDLWGQVATIAARRMNDLELKEEVQTLVNNYKANHS
ncbi:site-specific integrase [uncultured Methanoregula sp.]|uniref:tyrosine-type recombinase/integrase n=1 Tax=uncultured Methanoregula sp. TaxID=1005933 RepID=UPI002AAB79B2|nr:site-specific integrase [uncultured Methanoregula sp.]